MIEAITSQFESGEVQTLILDGEPAWAARQIGTLLEYSGDGTRLGKMIRDEERWGQFFEEGVDYVLLSGAQISDVVGGVSGRNKVLVLRETGLWKVLLKSTKPLSNQLHQFLSTEVLPQIARTGTYAPDATQQPARLEMVPVAPPRELEGRLQALEAENATLLGGIAQLSTAVGDLIELQRQQLAAPAAQLPTREVRVEVAGATIHVQEPVAPPGFSFRGLSRLAEASGCSSQKMRKRLTEVQMWENDEWHRPVMRPVVRGSRTVEERLHLFRGGVLTELHDRETRAQLDLLDN